MCRWVKQAAWHGVGRSAGCEAPVDCSNGKLLIVLAGGCLASSPHKTAPCCPLFPASAAPPATLAYNPPRARLLLLQVRRRDAGSKKVVAEERRYDTTEERESSSGSAPPTAAQRSTGSEVADGLSGTTVFDSMFGYSAASFGHTYGSTDAPPVAVRPAGANNASQFGFGGGSPSADPYAWANKLRDLPEEDALAELSMMGYTDGTAMNRRGGADKFSFANGTGSSSKKGKRRNPSVGRATPRRR